VDFAESKLAKRLTGLKEPQGVVFSPGKEVARWGASGAAGNFPMALDAQGQRLFVAYRMPALLAAFDTSNGEIAAKSETCRDADDVFHDAARGRVYVVCGEGAVAVLDAKTCAK
jgi:hypothetical protein